MKLILQLDGYRITDTFEVLNSETGNYDNETKKKVEEVKNRILKIKLEKNVSFFLALKEILADIKGQFNSMKLIILLNNIEAIDIDIKTIKDLNSFFVYSIYSCSGSECHNMSSDFGIMFDDIKIEILNGKIRIKGISN